MRTETRHTLQLEPRLWTGVRYDNKREGDKSYQLVSRDEFGVVADIDPGGFATDEDAELMQQRILLCVNLHDELVEVITASLDALGPDTRGYVRQTLTAVLAKVKP